MFYMITNYLIFTRWMNLPSVRWNLCKVNLLLVSFAAIMGCHAKLLPTNGCSIELYIPFSLLLRTNKMHAGPIKFLVIFATKNPTRKKEITSQLTIHSLTAYKSFSISHQDLLNWATMNEPCRKLFSYFWQRTFTLTIRIISSNTKIPFKDFLFW